MDSKQAAIIATEWLEAREGNEAADNWLSVMRTAVPSGRQSMKSWLSEQSEQVATLQLSIRDGRVTSVWTPGYRTVTTGATFADFDGSRRDFAGVEAIGADADTWVGYDKDMSTIIVHTVSHFGNK